MLVYKLGTSVSVATRMAGTESQLITAPCRVSPSEASSVVDTLLTSSTVLGCVSTKLNYKQLALSQISKLPRAYKTHGLKLGEIVGDPNCAFYLSVIQYPWSDPGL